MNIVLLRGLIREKRHWGDFPQKLKRSFPDAKILTPEIQGTGEHHKMSSPANFDEMISFMRERLAGDLQGKSNIVVAISLGGMLAKRWSELYPADFQKLVLLNTSFKGVNPLLKRLRLQSFLGFLRVFATFDAAKREALILDIVCNSKVNRAELEKLWSDIQRDAPVNRSNALKQLRAALTFSPSPAPPTGELLVLAGKKDKLCSWECSRELAKRWKGRLEVHPEAGHDLPIDAGDWVAQKIKDFV